jgi:hypothetical protein
VEEISTVSVDEIMDDAMLASRIRCNRQALKSVLAGKAAWSAIEPIVEEQREFHCIQNCKLK